MGACWPVPLPEGERITVDKSTKGRESSEVSLSKVKSPSPKQRQEVSARIGGCQEKEQEGGREGEEGGRGGGREGGEGGRERREGGGEGEGEEGEEGGGGGINLASEFLPS